MKLIKRDYSKQYHENPAYREAENSQRNRRRLDLLLKQQQNGSLLEIGCGTGGFLRLAQDHFAVEGIDISAYAIKTIRPQFGDRVSVYNIEQRPLNRNAYDVIAVFNILEHLRQPHKVIEKLYGALKTGGVIIGSVPNNQKIVGRLITRVGNFFDRTHISTFSPEVWRRMFAHSGFQSVETFGEINLGRNHCRYIQHPLWPHLSFNLMFICKK